MTTFPCTSCGACCSSIDGIRFLQEFNVQGICKHLVNRQCNIYEERPLLCRINQAFDEIFSSYMTKEEYYEANAKACNELQQRLGIPESYRVFL